jgi:predicted transcriptional regulator
MTGKPRHRPTDAELAVLRVLWEEGASTVRAVHERLAARSDARVGYTTVLKTLQIMMEKGLVQRDDSRRAHVYEAAVGEDETQRRLLGELLERAYRGSASRLVMQALSGRKATKEELDQIRRFLDGLEAAPQEEENDDD